MAAEVPISDVLCEAMEYLSKLGSNLRTRSENLREKKIRKDKLKNAHAVQKAASKVLLICELSKKSLDNVETGVRKVLSLLEASQGPSSIGGKFRDAKLMENKYHYFEYHSRKLRIAKKIPLNHFMSVKVIANKMSSSTLEKYPVYYNCKLKWKRRKLEKRERFKEAMKRRTSLSLSNKDSENKIHHSGDGEQSNVLETEHNVTEDSVFDSNNSTDGITKLVDRRTLKNVTNACHEKTDTKDDSSDVEVIEKSSTSKSNDHTDKIGNLSESKTVIGRVRFSDVYSDSNDDTQHDTVSQNLKTSGENIDSEESNRMLTESHNDSNCQLEPESEKAENDSEKNNQNDKNGILESGASIKTNDHNDPCSKPKPLIRCVNLSKLLKPDVISDNNVPNNKGNKELSRVTKSFSSKKFKGAKESSCGNDNKIKSQLINDKYWIQKRKEVAEFKAKKFFINIEKLPDLTKSFLLAHNLKRITKNGDIISEIMEEKDPPNSRNIKEVKNALLYDSESDESIEKLEVNKLKKSLLRDSDSDNNLSHKNNEKSHEQDKNTDINSIKNSLLIESDSENNGKNIGEKSDIICINNAKESTNVCETVKNNEIMNHEISELNNESGKESETGNNTRENEETNIEHRETPTKLDNIESLPEKLDAADETPSKRNARSKSSLLDSSAEEFVGFDKDEIETPSKTTAKIKHSLLNDSSDEKSNKIGEDTLPNTSKTKPLLTDSSDEKSVIYDVKKNKHKSSKSKLKHIRKSREAKRKLYYSSSSDGNEQEKHINKSRKKKISSSSSQSSSEDGRKKQEKALKIRDSNSEKPDKAEGKSIYQVDGADDKQSESSVDKMVRSKAKPSGSSSQISDSQDSSDKDIEGLTNLKNLNKHRRGDTSKKNNDDSKSKSRRMKSTPILGEDLLKAEPSNESSSEASDHGDNEVQEELPPVSLPGLNGDTAIDYMSKEELLGDTDSSVSHEKTQSENADNMDDTDESESLKSRRRKPNAISSDSEGGPNRGQRDDERMSDFEDSEEDSSEPAKKAKRKKKVTDSDASVDSSDGGQKKRRRIKTVRDSDVSGSDTENEGRNKHGRKNIRKVMGKNQLEEATKKAAREEKERIARIAERQKMYNNLDFDESGKPDEVVLDKVVLDFDPETKEPLIQVDRGLVKKLKPHQANGIKFMWDACFESVKRIKKDKGSGCILAHCMGLGKTLQVISLTHTLLTHGSLTGVNRVLVVCPLSTVLNWVNEFNMWLKHAEAEFDVDVYELSRYKQNSERAFQLQQWFDNGGVCVLGYEMFRNLSADNPKKFKKKMLKSFQQSLVDPGPDLVVCDEGHLLKNEKTSLSQSMNRVKTLRRIVLTGTPLQNNLKEYYCMVQFVKPNLLGKYSEYLNRFVNPITNGQYTDSTEHDIRIMKRRSHVLHKMLDGAVQRRDYGVLAPFLPPKHEYVLFITLTDVQIKLYEHYLEHYSRKPMSGRTGFLFPDFQSLQRIWTHPLVLKYNSERYEIMQQKKREREEEEESDGSQGSLAEFIDDESTPDETSTEESSDDSSDASDDSRKKSKKKKSTKKKESKISTRRGTRANPALAEDVVSKSEDVIEIKNDNPTEWWIKLVDDSELDDMRNSHKLILLFDILRQCENIGDKLLVFSQSLYSLDLIEHFLGKVDEATQEGRIDEKLGGHVGSWSPGIDYFRLDGSTSCENRSIWCKNFNRVDNPRARLFLISTRAGGLGINLVAANRVVIFDVSWNPSHDVQSIFRVYRFGQKKPCYVYRFLAMGTMEEKIYERQVTKQAISKRVIDEQQIDRHYAENDLAELYKFEARPTEPRPLPTLPKDRLFAEMLKEHEAQIYKYHEHDSLLENKEEETLSEEERKAAWEDFENEKTRPLPAPFPSPWTMHNGMVPGLLAQQQQMAYVALANFLRNDMPNISDNQIRDMLPILLNSPAVMQKVNEAYKYAPGMLNPGMMNSMGAGAGAAGGASALQYEPPWQRQHQQQQQLRLQQLMQHQNQMGAKFYAGGLGSRDPVAMALQQQRAREIMLGGAARPRGRPPLAPRAPAADHDIVNLDSD